LQRPNTGVLEGGSFAILKISTDSLVSISFLYANLCIDGNFNMSVLMDFHIVCQRSSRRDVSNLMCIKTELVSTLSVLLFVGGGGDECHVECEARLAEGVSAVVREPDESPYNEQTRRECEFLKRN
jgi:hypothetical protein